jgi:hypothetical protein
MAHYAFLDENNIVTEVITGRDEWEIIDGISDWEEYYGSLRGQRCLRTSYNNNIRAYYAAIGYTYDAEQDVFIPPQTFPSWILNADYRWEAPISKPETSHPYFWDEESVSWKIIAVDEVGDTFDA